MSKSQSVHAGFWMRFAALLIDSAILYVPLMLLEGVVRGAMYGGAAIDPGAEDAFMRGFLPSLLVQVGCGILYFGVLQGYLQATPGKMLLGLQIVSANKMGRVSIARILARYCAQFLSALVLCIGYLMAGFGEHKQALHDVIAKTYVVRKSALKAGARPVPIRRAA